MAEMKKDDLPKFLVYDAKNGLDVSATLKNIPEHLDKTLCFFREVPEWFEAGTDDLEEMREILTAIDNMPAEEREKHSPEDIRDLRLSIERMLACYEMTADPALSDDQKEVLRCICYWFSLKAMHAVPLSAEDEEEIF